VRLDIVAVRLDIYLPDQTMIVQVLVYEFDFDLAVFSPSLNRDYTACPVVLTARARKAGYRGDGAAAGAHGTARVSRVLCRGCFVVRDIDAPLYERCIRH